MREVTLRMPPTRAKLLIGGCVVLSALSFLGLAAARSGWVYYVSVDEYVQNPPPEELVARVLERAKPGDIIVMHDGHPANKAGSRSSLVAALPEIIDGLLAKGLHPVSLDQAFPPKR